MSQGPKRSGCKAERPQQIIHISDTIQNAPIAYTIDVVGRSYIEVRFTLLQTLRGRRTLDRTDTPFR